MLKITWVNNTDDLTDVYSVRREVFIKEQKISQDIEFDGTDRYSISVLLYDDDIPIATGRVILVDELYTIGRISVLKEYRNKKYGKKVVNLLLGKALELGATSVHTHAQTHVVDFYKKLGFECYGDEYKEAGIPHVNMFKKIV